MEGVRVGRYRLVRRVGAGGMAEVWEARMEGPSGFEKRVAVKRILPHLCDDDDLMGMFRDEARLASRLSHAHVAQVFDFGETDDAPFLVMEWVHGRDLRRVLRALKDRGEVLGPARTAAIGRAVAAALAHAHGLRDEEGRPLEVVHRDVSPQNVLVSFAGEVKLADFGIAKAARRSTHTGVGVIKGKASYMSPEQARGEPVDGRSDLFSLGVVLWECLAGRRLFRGESDLAVMRSIVHPGPPPPPPSSLRADVPPSLDAVVGRCLERDPAARFGSARELEHALGDVLLEVGASSRELDLAPLLRRLFPEEAEGGRRETARMAPVAVAESGSLEPDDLEIDVELPEAEEGTDTRGPGPREAPTASLSAFRAGRWGARTWAAVPAVVLLTLAAAGGWLVWPGAGASADGALDGSVDGAQVEEPEGEAPGEEPVGRALVEEPESQAQVEEPEGQAPGEESAPDAGGVPEADVEEETPAQAAPRPAAPRPRPVRRAPRPAPPPEPDPEPGSTQGTLGGVASLAQPLVPATSDLPRGTELRLRLTAPAAAGLPVEGALVASVIRHGRVLLPRGSRLTGTASERNGRLLVTFEEARSPAGRVVALTARVRGDDGRWGVALDVPHPSMAAAASALPAETELRALVE